MSTSRSLSDLLQSSSPRLRGLIARHWRAPQVSADTLSAHVPEASEIFELINECGREERWTLFDVIDQGGVAPASFYPRRFDSHNNPLTVEIDQLRIRGLLFKIRGDVGDEDLLVLANHLLEPVMHYREQVLILKVFAMRQELERAARRYKPLRLPAHIQPHYPLSHLVASGDPEGFRLPLSRAFGIPEFFPAKLKNTLKQLLHNFYIVFLPQLGKLQDDRIYELDHLVSLAMGLAALLSHHHGQDIDAELCADEDRRPFASPNVLLSGARRSLWRSFLVLFFNQFLTPIGGTMMLNDEQVQIYPSGFRRLDLEIQPSRWIRQITRELEQDLEEIEQ